jgi:hypothetical protein
MIEIVVELPADRRYLGTLTLKNDQGRVVAGPFPAFGKADNITAINHANAARDPTLPYGDTPEGSYEVTSAVATGDGTHFSSHSYGVSGALALRPVNGQALTAAGNGRTGLMIHGGELGAGGRVRPTHGCIRLSDADMAALITGLETIATAGNAPVCSIQRINATVTMGDTDAGEDDGDPPPYIDQILNGTGPDPIIWHP